MSAFRIVPLATATADHVRAHGTDPVWGHAASASVATGFGPCRVCLDTFAEGTDRRILFTHDTYAGAEDQAQPGPVYVHEHRCAPYADAGRFPAGLRDLELTFEAIGRPRLVRAVVHARGADGDAVVAQLLDRPDTDYVTVRNRHAGCFVLRAEPAA
jgi:hypothetical protein